MRLIRGQLQFDRRDRIVEMMQLGGAHDRRAKGSRRYDREVKKALSRTSSGFQDLLSAAGFELTAVIPTRGSVSVIEARPV